MSEKYRPKSVPEMNSFLSLFCERCSKDSDEDPCEILIDVYSFHSDHQRCPKEWTFDPWGYPMCGEFDPLVRKRNK